MWALQFEKHHSEYKSIKVKCLLEVLHVYVCSSSYDYFSFRGNYLIITKNTLNCMLLFFWGLCKLQHIYIFSVPFKKKRKTITHTPESTEGSTHHHRCLLHHHHHHHHTHTKLRTYQLINIQHHLSQKANQRPMLLRCILSDANA